MFKITFLKQTRAFITSIDEQSYGQSFYHVFQKDTSKKVVKAFINPEVHIDRVVVVFLDNTMTTFNKENIKIQLQF